VWTSLFFALLFYFLAAFIRPPVTYLRPRLDSTGHGYYLADGMLAMEFDWRTDLREQWPSNLCVGLTIVLVARAAFFCFLPSSKNSPDDRSA
jgi:hypothetical protein